MRGKKKSSWIYAVKVFRKQTLPTPIGFNLEAFSGPNELTIHDSLCKLIKKIK